MQATAIATWQAHGAHDDGAGWQPQLHPFHRQRQTEQVTTPQEWRPTGIGLGTPSLRHLHLGPASHAVSKKYAYADDLTIMHTDGNWQAVEGVRVLSKDKATLGEYLQIWKLKLSTTQTLTAVVHLNKEAKREVKVNHNNETLFFCSVPKYLAT